MSSSKRRRGWLVVLGVVLVVLVAGVVFRQGLGRFLVRSALDVAARRYGFEASYDSITGDLYHRPALHGVRLALDGDSVRVARLELTYNPLGLLSGRIPVSTVTIDRPEVFVRGEREPVGDKEPGAKLRFPRTNVRELVIADGRVFLGDTLAVDSIGIRAAFGSSPSALAGELEDLSARVGWQDISVGGISARFRLTPDSVEVKGLEVRTDRSLVSGDVAATLDGKGIRATLENLRVDLAEFTDAEGTVVGSGTAGIGDTSRFAELDLAASGVRVSSFELPAVSCVAGLEGSRAELVVAGNDPRFGEFMLEGHVDLDSLDVGGTARLDGARLRALDEHLPDEAVTAEVAFGGRAPDSLWFRLGASVPGLGADSIRVRGSYAAGDFVLDRAEIEGSIGRLWADGSYRGDRIEGGLLLDGFDVSVLAGFARARVEGRVTGVASFGGVPDSLALAGGLRAEDIVISTVEAKRAVLEFDVAVKEGLTGRFVLGGEEASLEGMELEALQLTYLDGEFDARVDRLDDRLTAAGTAVLGETGADCNVTSFSFAGASDTLTIVKPFGFSWRGDSIFVTGAEYDVADGTVFVDLRAGPSGLPAVNARGMGLNLRKLQKLFGIPTELWGTFDFTLAGQDTFDVTLSGRDVEAVDIGLRLKALAGAIRASNTGLELDSLWFVHAAETSRVHGSVEYELCGELEIRDVDAFASLADPGPWVLAFLQPDLEVRAGKVYAELAMTGGVTVPNLNGRIRLVRGVLAVSSLNLVAERVNAELTASGDRIVLEKLSGGAGTGIITGSGFVDLGEEWQVDSLRYSVRPDKATIHPLPEVYAVVSGEIGLAWGSGMPFVIDGDVEVTEALLAYGFGQSTTPVSGEGDGMLVLYDIHVRGDRGIWLRNRMADIEMAVDLSIRKTREGELYIGSLETRQGNIYYLDHTLRVSRGEILFENIARLDPALDIVAELPVRSTGENLPDKVLLTLAGTLEKPEFRFSSEPGGWDENEIITYLTLNVTTEELSSFENREQVAQYLSERLLGYFQTQVTKQVRKWVALDALSFESELTGGEGYKLTVGKYVGPNLYVTYTQNFTGEMEPEFRIEYYLDRRNEIVGERSEDGRYSVRYRYRLRY